MSRTVSANEYGSGFLAIMRRLKWPFDPASRTARATPELQAGEQAGRPRQIVQPSRFIGQTGPRSAATRGLSPESGGALSWPSPRPPDTLHERDAAAHPRGRG